jgi:hypothetical protein
MEEDLIDLEKKSRVSLWVLTLASFIGTIEYAVVMPSLWLYLESLGQTNEWFLGLVKK